MLLLSLGSLAAATPYLGAILFAVILAWLNAARSLSGQFEDAMAAEAAKEKAVAETGAAAAAPAAAE